MEVQSVINESALKEARKYLIKPGIRKISAIASAAFVLLAAYCMLAGRPSTMLLAVFAIVIFYGELKMIESRQIKGFLKKLDELYGKKEVIAPIVFRDADILIQNPLSGGKNAVRYEVMDTLIETALFPSLYKGVADHNHCERWNGFRRKRQVLENDGRKDAGLKEKIWKEIIQNICKMEKIQK